MLEKELSDSRAVLFDFDGVLCNDRFYDLALRPEHAPLCDWIQENFFRNPDEKETLRKWMRGQIGYREVNAKIAQTQGLDREWLDAMLLESVRRMRLDEGMMSLAADLKAQGKRIGIVTDNMDVFSLITLPEKKLDCFFDVVSNSSDCGMLKKDAEGEVFDRVLAGLGCNITETCFIDDNAGNVELFRRKGGQGIVWKLK